MLKELSEKAIEELTARFGTEYKLVLLRRVFRNGNTTYEPLPRLLAEMTLACIPLSEPEVMRAKIIPLCGAGSEVVNVRREQVGVREVNLRSVLSVEVPSQARDTRARVTVPVRPVVLVPERSCVLH